jgi:hypothetical protein
LIFGIPILVLILEEGSWILKYRKVGISLLLGVFVMISNLREDMKCSQAIVGRVSDFLSKSQTKLAVTKEGWIALSYAQTRRCDLIFLLSGCSMPVILRSYEDGYRVVRKTYVNLIIAGKAMDGGANMALDCWNMGLSRVAYT